MEITINGSKSKVEENSSLMDILSMFKVLSVEDVVVEYNGKIIEKNLFETTIVRENDSIEVVSFVGGG